MTEPKERTSGVKAVGTLIEYRSFKKRGSSEAELPHFCITPGGVEADGAHPLLPLHAVDRQLPLHGGGRRPGGIAHRPEDGPRQHQGPHSRHRPPPQQKYPHSPVSHGHPVLFRVCNSICRAREGYDRTLWNDHNLGCIFLQNCQISCCKKAEKGLKQILN